MRVGHPFPAGFQPRRLLLVAVLGLALPATATAQDPDPSGVVFTQVPSGTRPSQDETVAFTAAGASSFECVVDDEAPEECRSPVTVRALPAGVSTSRAFTVRALDADREPLAQRRASWVVDADPPEVRIDPVPAPLPAGPARVGFEGDSDTVGFECSSDGGTTYTECFSPHPVIVRVGDNELRVRATDAVGNVGAPAVRTWTGVAPPPAGRPTITGGPASDPTADDTATFAFSAPGAERYACALDEGAPAPCDSPHRLTGLTDGRHELRVRGVNAAGELGLEEAVSAWTVDTKAPVITVAERPRRVETTTAYSVRFTVADTTTTTVRCELDGAPLASCAPGTPLAGTVPVDGLHRLLIRATDALGRTSVERLEWEVDLTGPVVTFTSVPPASTPAAAIELAYGASGAVPGLTCLLDGVAFDDCDGSSMVNNAALALGPHTFEVRARDALGNEGTQTAAWTKPLFDAAFDWAPAALVDRPVTFTSRTAGDAEALAWDLDGDGDFDDARGAAVEHTFAAAGVTVVRLRATHPSGVVDVAAADVAVGRTPLTNVPPGPSGEVERRPPTAAFGIAPQAPVAGQEVTLTSTSSDPDGSIAATAWDLDGDGAYDDAGGPAAARAFPAGVHSVGLRVTDSDGLTATAFATITVAAAPGAPAPPPGAAAPKALKLLTPFPTVRIAGTAVGGRIQLRILAVKAPRNTSVEVRCSGRGCPFAVDRHRITGKARVVRIRRLENRPLRAGIVLEIRVHAAGRVGKYTRLLMRSGAAPKRTDACVSGPRAVKTACPA